MAVSIARLLRKAFRDLRIHPIEKRIRATLGDATIVDTTRAVIVWEPRRVVASYAVPVEDIAGDLVPWAGEIPQEHPVRVGEGPPVLDPGTPFAVHGGPGTAFTIVTSAGELPGAAFRPDDPELAGHVVLDWDAFGGWLEEDEPVIGHPRDPFDRIDCLRSSRHVVFSHAGQVLADSTRPTLLFETPLPMRYYLPREDVRMDLLSATRKRTVCAYKGVASYWSAHLGDETLPDIAWSYEHPLNDAVPVRGLLAFFTERLDLVVDGEPVPRPVTPWS